MTSVPNPAASTSPPPCGFLNVDKPANCTSRAIVTRISQRLKLDCVGHAGTLDPMATGVLVIAIDEATKYVRYAQEGTKTYRGGFRLGFHSDTEDSTGTVTVVKDSPKISRQELEAVLPKFVGTITQMPPQFSAKKIGGRRAYTLARKGKTVDLKPVEVRIDRLELLDFSWPNFELEIVCGHGTYVRSLGRDIASALQTSAIMTSLSRTAVGAFQLEQSLGADDLTVPQMLAALQPVETAMDHLGLIQLTPHQVERVKMGQRIDSHEIVQTQQPAFGTDYRMFHESTGEFIGLAHWRDEDTLQPKLLRRVYPSPSSK